MRQHFLKEDAMSLEELASFLLFLNLTPFLLQSISNRRTFHTFPILLTRVNRNLAMQNIVSAFTSIIFPFPRNSSHQYHFHLLIKEICSTLIQKNTTFFRLLPCGFRWKFGKIWLILDPKPHFIDKGVLSWNSLSGEEAYGKLVLFILLLSYSL